MLYLLTMNVNQLALSKSDSNEWKIRRRKIFSLLISWKRFRRKIPHCGLRKIPSLKIQTTTLLYCSTQ